MCGCVCIHSNAVSVRVTTEDMAPLVGLHPEPAPNSKTLPTKACMHHGYFDPSPLGKMELPKKATTAIKWTDLTNRCVLGLLEVGLVPGRNLGLADEGGDGGHGQHRLVGNIAAASYASLPRMPSLPAPLLRIM